MKRFVGLLRQESTEKSTGLFVINGPNYWVSASIDLDWKGFEHYQWHPV